MSLISLVADASGDPTSGVSLVAFGDCGEYIDASRDPLVLLESSLKDSGLIEADVPFVGGDADKL